MHICCVPQQHGNICSMLATLALPGTACTACRNWISTTIGVVLLLDCLTAGLLDCLSLFLRVSEMPSVTWPRTRGGGTSWAVHQTGSVCACLQCRLSIRSMLLGVVLTLGAQLLLALLLRTLWAQRAMAALESWLQSVFGVSLRNGRAGYFASRSMGEDSGDGLEAELDSDSSSSGGSSAFSSGGSRSSSSSGVNVRSRHGKPGEQAVQH